MPKKAVLDSECLCFDELPERRFELVGKLQSEKLPGDLQDAEYLLVTGFQFQEEFLPLQLKYHLFVGGQDRAFLNGRNREDETLQKIYEGSCIGKYVVRKLFIVGLPC
jgi:hypothetical protein